MKKYTLSSVGKVEINTYGTVCVDDIEVLVEFANSFGIGKEDYESKQFAGKVEITITDLTEPLEIDAKEC